MSLPSLPTTGLINWALISQETDRTLYVAEEARSRLSPEDGRRFTKLFLDFTWSNPPSVIAAQETLRSIIKNDTMLLSRYSSFLTHRASTPAECEAARAEFGRIFEYPMLTVSSPAPGFTSEDFLAALEGQVDNATFERFMQTYLEGPQNTVAGIPTRPSLIKLLIEDKDLLRRFEILWPKERGDLW